jgi:Uri superfamily endonuclease
MVLWADSSNMDEKYLLAKHLSEQTGAQWHVDHIVPLFSSLVCGLHCEANMQVIPAEENISKSNRVWPDMPKERARV